MIVSLLVQIGALFLVFALIVFAFLLKISKEMKEDEDFREALMRENRLIKSIYD